MSNSTQRLFHHSVGFCLERREFRQGLRPRQGLGLSGAGTDRQPVQIGSQLGSLWRQSGFAADRLMLDWTRGTVSYRLSADAEAVTREDLVRMAESVP